MTKAEAIALMDDVNAALDAARKLDDPTRSRMGAINWGDLGCADVEERKSLLSDSSMIAVTIEEVAPDAAGLHAFVGDWLEKRGWKDVYVVTEW